MKPEILSLNPETGNRKPETRNPKPETNLNSRNNLNPKPTTPALQRGAGMFGSGGGAWDEWYGSGEYGAGRGRADEGGDPREEQLLRTSLGTLHSALASAVERLPDSQLSDPSVHPKP